MTILALDPDLFWAATINSRCNYLLEDIAERIQNGAYQLALDGSTLEAEFVELYNQFAHKTDGNGTAIAQIYGPVAKGFRRNRVVDLSSDPVTDMVPNLSTTLEQYLVDNHCLNPVEPELVRMAFRGCSRLGRGNNVVIVLVGDDVPCSERALRPRGLNEARARVELENRLRIQVQSVSNLVPPVRDPSYRPDVEPSHYHSQTFELEVRIKTHNMYGAQIISAVPLGQLGLGENEDIDIYLVKRTENTCKVWIGECKLYKEGRESEWVGSEKIQQLRKRLPKVKEYEEGLQGCLGEVEVYGLLVSNAGLTEKENWLWLVNEMKSQNIQVYFYQAMLARGWSRPGERLSIVELNHIESPFDESYNLEASP